MDVKSVPGQTGQPPKDIQGPSFDTISWTGLSTTVSTVNKYQEPMPVASKVHSNDSETPAYPTPTNTLNGGRDVFSGGGVG